MDELTKLKIELSITQAQYSKSHDAAWLLASFIKEKHPDLIDDFTSYVESYEKSYENDSTERHSYWHTTMELAEVFNEASVGDDANLDSLNELAKSSRDKATRWANAYDF